MRNSFCLVGPEQKVPVASNVSFSTICILLVKELYCSFKLWTLTSAFDRSLKSRGHPPDPAAPDPDLKIQLLFWTLQFPVLGFLAPLTTGTLCIQLSSTGVQSQLNNSTACSCRWFHICRRVKPLRSTAGESVLHLRGRSCPSADRDWKLSGGSASACCAPLSLSTQISVLQAKTPPSLLFMSSSTLLCSQKIHNRLVTVSC